MVFDSDRAILKGPDQFKRFNVTSNGVPLPTATVSMLKLLAEKPIPIAEQSVKSDRPLGGRRLAS